MYCLAGQEIVLCQRHAICSLQAIKVLNMIKVYGKPIRVNKASQDKRTQDVGANMFIGNLDPEVDEKVWHACTSLCPPAVCCMLASSLQSCLPVFVSNTFCAVSFIMRLLNISRRLMRFPFSASAALVRHIQCLWCDCTNTKDYARPRDGCLEGFRFRQLRFF